MKKLIITVAMLLASHALQGCASVDVKSCYNSYTYYSEECTQERIHQCELNGQSSKTCQEAEGYKK